MQLQGSSGTSLNANVLEEQPTYLRRDDEVNDGFTGQKPSQKAFEPNDGSNEGTIFFKEVRVEGPNRVVRSFTQY